MNLIDQKKTLRNDLLARRDAIEAAERQRAQTRIAEIGAESLSAQGPLTISVFRSFGNELDTAPLMQALAARGHTLCLPVIVARGQPLIFRAWMPGEPLVPGKFRIDVPAQTQPVLDPEILLVPLLGFDEAGYRLGYGGGYYDRTIAGLRARKPILAIGLAFAAQRVDHIPRADYDERLDGILTERGYRLFDR